MLLYIAVMTYLLLLLSFGSVLLPLKAIAMNMLSLTATFGVLVWIFQDGHLNGLLGFDPTGNIEPNMPIMLFALIFGLSMDYEVFLVSRMREQYDKQGDSKEAVATGLRSTGRLVVSAAVLMCVPLAAIGMSGVLTIKLFGVGMVFAVLTDVLWRASCRGRPSCGCWAGLPGGLRHRWRASTTGSASRRATSRPTTPPTSGCPPGSADPASGVPVPQGHPAGGSPFPPRAPLRDVVTSPSMPPTDRLYGQFCMRT
ncbi:MMPL family transporter [Streptomyces sp. NPDC046862]|uniref:MMPL family transporter n=1 Tax=Streptomyces sp. NPDC046862 TaxID=3154603 RepID=UPI0034511F38